MRGYLTVQQFAEELGVSTRSIWRWAHAKPGFPRPIKLLDKSLWKKEKIDEWLEKEIEQAEREAEIAQKRKEKYR